MSIFQRIAVFSTGTPSAPNITLEQSLLSDGTEIIISGGLPISDEELAKAFGVAIGITSAGQQGTDPGYTEVVFTEIANVSADKKTISSLDRGIDSDGSEIVSNSALIGEHPAGSRVECVVLVQNMNQLVEVILGERGTGKGTFQMGLGDHSVQQGYEIDGGGANPVQFGIDTSGNPIIQREDGSTFLPGAGVGSISGGDGIDVTSSVISVDLSTDDDVGLIIDSTKLKVKGIATPVIYTPAFLTGGSSAESDYTQWITLGSARWRQGFDGTNYDFDVDLTNSAGTIADGISGWSPSGTWLNIITASSQVGQNFLVPSNVSFLEKARVPLRKVGTPVQNVTLNLYAVDGSGHPTGASLASKSLAPGSFSTDTVVEFDFGITAVTPSTTYAFVLTHIDEGANKIQVNVDNLGNHYADGFAVVSTDGGSSWINLGSGSGDTYFQVDGFFGDVIQDMDGVLARLQTGIRNITGGNETSVWDTDHVVISSGDTTSSSAITVTSTHSGGGGTDISGAGASDWLDADSGNGVVTAKALDKTVYENFVPLLNVLGEIDSQFLSDEVREAETAFSITDITGAQLQSLKDGSDVDLAHTHLHLQRKNLGATDELDFYLTPQDAETAGSLGATEQHALYLFGIATGAQSGSFVWKDLNPGGGIDPLPLDFTSIVLEFYCGVTVNATGERLGVGISSDIGNGLDVVFTGTGSTNDFNEIGILFEWVSTTTVNIKGYTKNGTSTANTIDISLGASEGDLNRFKIVKTGESVEFFFNGSSIGTLSTDIPTGGFRSILATIQGATGAGARLDVRGNILFRSSIT